MPYIETWENGVMLSRVYEGTIDSDRLSLTNDVDRQASDLIYALAPGHTQRNAALGILTPEETAYVTAVINHYRNQARAMKDSLQAAQTPDDLYAVNLAFTPFS